MLNLIERQQLLDQIDAGQVTVAEAVARLHAADRPAPREDLTRWRRGWWLPFGAGLALTLAGGGLMYWALRAADFRLSGGLFLAAGPFALGVLIMALAAAASRFTWLHLRVRTAGRSLALSFPLPMRLAAWGLRRVGPRLPALRQTGLDELIEALAGEVGPQSPLTIDVDKGEAGERLQVYIG